MRKKRTGRKRYSTNECVAVMRYAVSFQVSKLT